MFKITLGYCISRGDLTTHTRRGGLETDPTQLPPRSERGAKSEESEALGDVTCCQVQNNIFYGIIFVSIPIVEESKVKIF